MRGCMDRESVGCESDRDPNTSLWICKGMLRAPYYAAPAPEGGRPDPRRTRRGGLLKQAPHVVKLVPLPAAATVAVAMYRRLVIAWILCNVDSWPYALRLQRRRRGCWRMRLQPHIMLGRD